MTVSANSLRGAPFRSILVAAACLVTAYTLVTSLIIIYDSYSPLPLRDSWALWQRYTYFGSYRAFLFEPHNEHRIVVTRLAYIIDRFVFHGRSLFPLVCSLLMQAGTGLVIYRLIRQSGRASRLSLLLLACLIGSALSSAQQFDNLVLGFQIQFTMVNCASCASFLALVRSAERWRLGRNPDLAFAGSCVCALVATFSSANGLFLWPFLLSFGLWTRLPARFACAILLDTILTAIFYLRGYTSHPFHYSFAALIGVLARAAVFVGSPFDILRAALLAAGGAPSDRGAVTFAGAFGAAGIAGLIWSGTLLWRVRERYTVSQAALIHIAGFVVITAVLVGFGRADFPMVRALDSRYTSAGLLFWVAMGGFYWPFIERRLAIPGAKWGPIAITCVVLAIVVAVALRQPYWIRYTKDYAATLRQVQAAIVANVFDEPMWRTSYPPSGEMILDSADYLRRNHLSVFTEPWTQWLGRNVNGLLVVDQAKGCVGAFDSVTPIPSPIRPGWRVSGWAWDRSRRSGPGIVILVDSTRHIAGVVNNPVVREDVRLVIPEVRSSSVGWSGYVAGSARTTLTAYLLEGDGRSLCALGTR